MELLISGFAILLSIAIVSIWFYSFNSQDEGEALENSKHFSGHKKILTQDGMVAKKSSLDEPLFLIGDSKVVR